MLGQFVKCVSLNAEVGGCDSRCPNAARMKEALSYANQSIDAIQRELQEAEAEDKELA